MPLGLSLADVLANFLGRLDVDLTSCPLIVVHRPELALEVERLFACRLCCEAPQSVHVRSIQWLGKDWYKTGFLSSLVILYEAHHFMARSCGFLLDKWLGLVSLAFRQRLAALTEGLSPISLMSLSPLVGFLESLKDGVFPLYDYIEALKGKPL